MLVVLVLCRSPCVNPAVILSSLELIQASDRQLKTFAEVFLESSEIAWDCCSGLRYANHGAKDDGWDEPEVERGKGDTVGLDVNKDGGVESSGVRCGCGSEDSNADRSDEEKLSEKDGQRLGGAVSC